MAIELLKRRQQGEQTFVVEDESRLIYRCCLPNPLFDAMSQAPLVVVEVPQEERAEQIRQDYVHDLWLRYQAMFGAEEGWPLFATYLTDALAVTQAPAWRSGPSRAGRPDAERARRASQQR